MNKEFFWLQIIYLIFKGIHCLEHGQEIGLIRLKRMFHSKKKKKNIERRYTVLLPKLIVILTTI